ncbi:hypothetical protein [Streptomyces naphthomycinicus]|nr:hypothetical protein [Streptomyces sp. TML10]
MNKIAALVRRLSTLRNCECGSASVFQRTDGTKVCMDCGREWQ